MDNNTIKISDTCNLVSGVKFIAWSHPTSIMDQRANKTTLDAINKNIHSYPGRVPVISMDGISANLLSSGESFYIDPNISDSFTYFVGNLPDNSIVLAADPVELSTTQDDPNHEKLIKGGLVTGSALLGALSFLKIKKTQFTRRQFLKYFAMGAVPLSIVLFGQDIFAEIGRALAVLYEESVNDCNLKIEVKSDFGVYERTLLTAFKHLIVRKVLESKNIDPNDISIFGILHLEDFGFNDIESVTNDPDQIKEILKKSIQYLYTYVLTHDLSEKDKIEFLNRAIFNLFYVEVRQVIKGDDGISYLFPPIFNVGNQDISIPTRLNILDFLPNFGLDEN